MIDYSSLFDALVGTPLENWLEVLPGQIQAALHPDTNKLIPEWQHILEGLPAIIPSAVELSNDVVRVGASGDLAHEKRTVLEKELKKLHPWRKGPFNVLGIPIDTEWRSDLKWERLKNSIESLRGRRVLDIGCGNGYHCWRMRGAGADLVVGIDPMPLYVAQYGVLAHFLNSQPVYVLPLKVEDVPDTLSGFDTVFSMGVLYHRRSPIDHLLKIKSLLRARGEIVLETLVADGPKGYSLVPDGRYAKMRNVWFIPSVATLLQWVKRCGFKDGRVIDVTPTTSVEQRATEWMHFESLENFLDPEDPAKTIEGYPAPQRAIVLARS